MNRGQLLLSDTLRAMDTIQAAGHQLVKVRVSRLGVVGGPVTYLDREGGVVLLHPADWSQVWTEACRAPEFGLAATRNPTSLYGVPVQLDERVRPGAVVTARPFHMKRS